MDEQKDLAVRIRRSMRYYVRDIRFLEHNLTLQGIVTHTVKELRLPSNLVKDKHSVVWKIAQEEYFHDDFS